jgi:hypothetical protein
VSKAYPTVRSTSENRLKPSDNKALNRWFGSVLPLPCREREKTDASRDLVILAKDRRIKALEEENRSLKKQLQAALGKAYDQL